MDFYHSSAEFHHASWGHHEEQLLRRTRSSMHRYLLETDRPLFTTSPAVNDDLMVHALPGDPYGIGECMDHGLQEFSQIPRRLSSTPTSSGLESSGVSSGWSDHETPWPETNHFVHNSEFSSAHGAGFEAGLSFEHYSSQPGGYVAMNAVQRDADPPVDTTPSEHQYAGGYNIYGGSGFGPEPSGYQPQPDDDQWGDIDHTIPRTSYLQQAQQSSSRSESDAPVLRRRRPGAVRSTTSPTQTSRVDKRVSLSRTSSHQPSIKTESEESGDASIVSPSSVPFPCPLRPYGCSKTFASKNEWKRHVATQHMKVSYWRCDRCSKRNDFNRKDLFIQHVRRMHNTKDAGSPRSDSSQGNKGRKPVKPVKDTPEEQAAARRCYRQGPSLPENSCCLICDKEFPGPGSWDERMEHLGRHFEAVKKDSEASIDPRDWRFDASTHQWLVNERIIVSTGEGWILGDRSS